jgi:hypothetical protein
VQAVGELDDDDRALAWRAKEAAHDRPTHLASDLAQDDIHVPEASIGPFAGKRGPRPTPL